MEDYIRFEHVKKIYKMGENEIEALAGINFSILKGQFVIICGASGAGKSTILNILGGMDQVTSGRIIVDGREVSRFKSKELIEYRRFDVGFVFQFYNLVQNLTAKENIELASQICKNPMDIDEVIEGVGLTDRKMNFPSQLSGGEQQRVAIARALITHPSVIFADEPTGNLDAVSAETVAKMLTLAASKYQQTIVMVTHDRQMAEYADRILTITDGNVTGGVGV